MPRTALVDRLVAAPAVPVLNVTAPAGYGKTTLMAQWAHAAPASRGVGLGRPSRNDPAVLLTYLAVALDRLERIEPRVFRCLASPGIGIADVVRLVTSIVAMQEPVFIALDNADALTNAAVSRHGGRAALRLPAGSQLAVGGRQSMLAPIPRLRTRTCASSRSGRTISLWTRARRSCFLRARASRCPTTASAVGDRTEGWPAGLYLAALAMNAGGHHEDVGGTFAGDDRYMAEYLHAEFLSHVSRADVTFLTRTSILDRLSGPLCDATVGGKARPGRSTDSNGATCSSSRSTGGASGTATTVSSVSCSTQS